MWRSLLLQSVLRTIGTLALFLSCAQVSSAQLNPASTPIADPSDTRFQQVNEDWTTPALSTSNLRPVPPVVGYNNDYGTYTVELIQVQWRFGDPIDLYVMKPKKVNKPPVILYLYGYPSDTERFKDEGFQKKVTKDGFAAVGFVTALTGHRYHDRPMKEWFLSELQECLATSAHDVQMVLNYLEQRGDLDMAHVGIYAQGSGASIGILTSAADPRIKAFDALDPWGDWPTWMKASPFVPEEERADYLKPEFLNKVAALEPVNWLPKIQARHFRLEDATFDVKTPPSCKQKLRAAVPPHSTVVVYKTIQDFNALVHKGRELAWIESALRTSSEKSKQ